MAKRKPTHQPDPAPPPVRREHFLRSLRVQLTDEEIAQRADRAAHKLADVVAKKEELKAATKHQKGVIEALEAEVHELSGEVRTRSTYRMIECEMIFDYQSARVRDVRLDTGEVMNDRRMTDAERQRELPFGPDGEAGPEAPADEEGEEEEEADF